jgi:cytidylate kinase
MAKAVVIDGPAGSGKSTTAIALAKMLGFIYLDTGAMYRAVTLKFLDSKIHDLSQIDMVQQTLANTGIGLLPSENGLKVMLDDVDVTEAIRAKEVNNFVSEVSAVPEVREFMQAQQRQFARDHDVVAEGRDLGTYVFPRADVKIFLVADLEIRAQRRMKQNQAGAKEFGAYRDNLAKRDQIDSGRRHSPLKKAADAIEIDTTNLTFEQQVQQILEICQSKFGNR